MINLHIKPEVSGLPWEEFKDNKYSIALDGYVYDFMTYDMLNMMQYKKIWRKTRENAGIK